MLKQIWSDDTYVYTATSSGMDIIDIETEQKYAYIAYGAGFNTVWANNSRVYIGTPDDGIKYISKTTITGSIVSPPDLIANLMDYVNYPTITADNVRYIHGQDSLLMCCTVSGINTLGVYGYESKTLTPYAQKCFLSETNRLYYTTLSGSDYAINRVNAPYDWSAPDKIYSWPSLDINDICVFGYYLYAATSNGVYAIDDLNETYEVVPTVFGSFTSVWCANDRLMAAASDALYIMNMDDYVTVDKYSTTFSGSGGEKLDHDDIVDLVGS